MVFLPGTYDIEVRAFSDVHVDTGSFKPLQVTIINPCVDPTLNVIEMPESPLPQQTYYVGSGMSTYEV